MAAGWLGDIARMGAQIAHTAITYTAITHTQLISDM